MPRKLHNPKSHAPAVYIPCWLIQVSVKKLTLGAKMTYGRLSQWANATGQVYRSARQLAEELGCSYRSIEEYLKELRKVELIGTYHPQAGGVNHFEFYDHPWMHEPIKEQLTYKDDKFTPPHDSVVPSTLSCGTPPHYGVVINKKEIKEIKCVGADAAPTQNLTQLKKEKAENQALECEEAKALFEAKFLGLDVTIKQIFDDCREHYDQKNAWATKSHFIKWLKRESPENYKRHSGKAIKKETDEQRSERQYFEYELLKEREQPGYVSPGLKERPEMRQKYS